MKFADVFNYEEDGKGGFIIKKIKSKYFERKMAIVIPEKVTKIDRSALRESREWAYVLPDTLEEIGESAFYLCKQLELVYIPKSVKIIDTYAFYGCDKLEIYCEGEPAEGWIDQEPTYRTEEVYTAEDYAFDFHRGGVNRSSMQVKVYHNWNPDPRPVHTNCSREEFMKILKAASEN